MTAFVATISGIPARVGRAFCCDSSTHNPLTMSLAKVNILDKIFQVIHNSLSLSIHFGGDSPAQEKARYLFMVTRDVLAFPKIFTGAIPDFAKRCKEIQVFASSFFSHQPVLINKQGITDDPTIVSPSGKSPDRHYHQVYTTTPDKVMGIVIAAMAAIGDTTLVIAFGVIRPFVYAKKHFQADIGTFGHHITGLFSHVMTVMHVAGVVRQATTIGFHIKKYRESFAKEGLSEKQQEANSTEFQKKLVSSTLALVEKSLELSNDILHYVHKAMAPTTACIMRSVELVLELAIAVVGLIHGCNEVAADTGSGPWYIPDPRKVPDPLKP